MTKAFSLFLWQNSPSVNTPLGESKLNLINTALDAVDTRVVNMDTTKANQTDLLTAVADITYNESTGIFTVTKKNGSKTTIDTKLEKLAINFTYDSINQQLVIHLSDGTYQYVDLKSLITELEFLNSDTVLFSVTNGKVTANIAQGSITADMLEPNYLANVELYASQALQSAESAEESARNAEESALRAKEEADRASEIAGGDFATNTRVDKIVDGTTPVAKATDADTLDGLHANEIADGTNLLVNPDFAINTNGKTEYTATGYTVDKWQNNKLSSVATNGKVEVLTNGVKLTGGGTRLDLYFRQYIDNGAKLTGKTVTVSVMVEELSGSFYIGQYGGGNSKLINSNGVSSYTFTWLENSVNAIHLYNNTGSDSCIVRWVKLEIGKQATPFVPPNKDVEEIKIGHYVKVYKSLSELGLTEATATAESIVNAMANNSLLIHPLSGTATSGALAFPYNYSLFRVTKLANSYAPFECIGTGSGLIYYGYYNGGASTKWSGWSTKYLPLTGGTLSSELYFNGGYTRITGNANEMQLEARNEIGKTNNRRMIRIRTSASKTIENAIALTDVTDGTIKSYNVLHTGNSNKVAIQETAPSDTTALWVW